jgi:hypothetical protein
MPPDRSASASAVINVGLIPDRPARSWFSLISIIARTFPAGIASPLPPA